MPDFLFYQLTDSPLEALLPVLLEKAMGQGWRVAVQGPDAARLAFLDERLWTYSKESFLPHSQAGGPHDAAQPVLLGPVGAAANKAEMLVLVDGGAPDMTKLDAHKRVCIVFDGNDETMLGSAREQWRAVSSAGYAAVYWARQDGRWQQKATSEAKA
ncbi:MAG: DNA polymerase III subunit chi [Paracoccaceae bacterium]